MPTNQSVHNIGVLYANEEKALYIKREEQTDCTHWRENQK